MLKVGGLRVYPLEVELALKAHPGVEIESCSSGGARVDLGDASPFTRVMAVRCFIACATNDLPQT